MITNDQGGQTTGNSFQVICDVCQSVPQYQWYPWPDLQCFAMENALITGIIGQDAMRNKFSRRCERPFFMLEANLFKVFTSMLSGRAKIDSLFRGSKLALDLVAPIE